MPYSTPSFDTTQFKALIKKESGLVFEETRLATLAGGINQRMKANSLNSPESYLESLKNNAREIQNLINCLTVNETYFLREPAHFRLMVDRLLPEMLRRPKGDTVKILCAGCSTGEEPYSIAITLFEKFGSEIFKSVSILAGDIDTNVLAKAAEGIYTPISFRDPPKDFLERYFEPCGNGRQRLKDFIRKQVKFDKLNLSAPDLRQLPAGIDIIFYRNVSIYFDSRTQQDIFTKLAGLMRNDAYLIVSATETLIHNYGILPLVEKDGLFLFRKQDKAATTTGAGSVVIPLSGRAAPKPVKPLPSAKTRKPEIGRIGEVKTKSSAPIAESGDKYPTPEGVNVDGTYQEAMAKFREKNYPAALNSLDRLLEVAPGFIGGYTLKACIMLNQNRQDEARKMALHAVELDEFCLEAHLLLGMAARQAEESEEAIRRFKQAVYIDPASWLAHYYLADLHCARGEFDKACREFEVVVKVLSRGQSLPDALCFQFTAPPAQLIHLCTSKISQIRNRRQGTANGI